MSMIWEELARVEVRGGVWEELAHVQVRGGGREELAHVEVRGGGRDVSGSSFISLTANL